MTRPSAATVIKYSFGQHMKQTKKKKNSEKGRCFVEHMLNTGYISELCILLSKYTKRSSSLQKCNLCKKAN